MRLIPDMETLITKFSTRILDPIFIAAIVAVGLSGCDAPPANSRAANVGAVNANSIDAAVHPRLEELKALEAKAFEAYRTKDGKYFEGFLTDQYGTSSTGQRLDKAATIKMIAENKCDINSFSFSDETLTKLGSATAMLTMKVAADGTCEGRRVDSSVIAASLYVRKDTGWQVAWHGEVRVVDPKATPDNTKGGDKDATPQPTHQVMPDSQARELAAIEKSVWEGWMNRDAKKLDELTARELAFVNIFGDHFRNRADTLKNWSENPCEVKSVDVSDPTTLSVTPDTSILFHRGTAEGTCFGQEIGPILGTSVYVKEGPAWKVSFTMNMPMSRL